MLIKAYGKINIALDVTGKREDGYHLLKMIMQQIDLYDLISVEKDAEDITITCNKTYVPTDDKNLAYKAAKLFMAKYNINSGVKINIVKNIPVSAGLAGGSTNAAAVLNVMNSLFELNIPQVELMKLGLTIGADVPYCIKGGTALCEGIGEVITPLKSFRNNILVLVKPNFGVSTKEVYRSLDVSKIFKHPDIDFIIGCMERNYIRQVCSSMKNVLENVTVNKYVAISNIKKDMINMGALGSLMSGSGPTVFGFFDDMLKAQRCYDVFKENYNEVFITRTV